MVTAWGVLLNIICNEKPRGALFGKFWATF